MKNLIKIGGIVVLFGLLAFFGAQLLFTQEVKQIKPIRPSKPQDTIPKDTYVSKVIISAPWGEKNLYKYAGGEESPPGEFGYYVSEETELGPNAFTVAPNGDIYITDPLNKRIQKFSSEGGFLSAIPCTQMEHLCVDAQGNIYTGRFDHTAYPVVYKYNQSGNLRATYQLGLKQESGPHTPPQYVWDGSGELYCDNKGRLFITYQKFYDKPLFPGDTLSSKAGFLMQIGTSSMPLSFEQQKRTIKVGGFPGANTCALDRDQFFRSHSGKFYLVDFNEDTVKVITIPNLKGFIGFDGNLNAYTHDYDFEKKINVVRKYNPDGILISTIQYYPNHFVSPGVDCQGNLYVFTWFKDKGVEVTKCYKQ
jgi:hypothetical protein